MSADPRPVVLNAPGRLAPAQRFNTIAALALALLAVLFAGYGAVDRRAVLAAGEVSAVRIAEQTALSAQTTLDLTRQLMQPMSMLVDPPVRSEAPDPALVRRGLLRLQENSPYIMDLLIVGSDGAIRSWTGGGRAPDIADREYFSVHARATGSGLYVGAPLLSRVHDGRWFFALSEAIRDENGELRHVLVAIIDVAALRERVHVDLGVPGSTQALLSDSGIVYMHAPDHTRQVGRLFPVSDELIERASSPLGPGTLTTARIDQRERIAAFRRLEGYPITAVGTVLVDELLVDWRTRAWLLAMLWLAIAMPVAWTTRRANAISAYQRELALTDALTGVRNRRAILDTATSHLARSADHTGSLSLLMVDIDHFKDINDRFGHLVGDEVLRRVSQVLRTHVRATDIVGRYGGEEFLVLMPDTGAEGALQVAEKLRAAVADRVTKPQAITVSIGVAAASDLDASLDVTLSRADAALYRAKAAGRNRVAAG